MYTRAGHRSRRCRLPTSRAHACAFLFHKNAVKFPSFSTVYTSMDQNDISQHAMDAVRRQCFCCVTPRSLHTILALDSGTTHDPWHTNCETFPFHSRNSTTKKEAATLLTCQHGGLVASPPALLSSLSWRRPCHGGERMGQLSSSSVGQHLLPMHQHVKDVAAPKKTPSRVNLFPSMSCAGLPLSDCTTWYNMVSASLHARQPSPTWPSSCYPSCCPSCCLCPHRPWLVAQVVLPRWTRSFRLWC